MNRCLYSSFEWSKHVIFQHIKIMTSTKIIVQVQRKRRETLETRLHERIVLWSNKEDEKCTKTHFIRKYNVFVVKWLICHSTASSNLTFMNGIMMQLLQCGNLKIRFSKTVGKVTKRDISRWCSYIRSSLVLVMQRTKFKTEIKENHVII